MQPSKIVAAAAGATLAIALVVGITVNADDVAYEMPAYAKAAWREDGMKVYLVPVVLKDGTVAEKETTEAPCKRRPKSVDGSQCQRVSLDISGKPRIDPAPVLGRFAASDMLGDGCEPVACAVMAGDDAEAGEDPPVSGEDRR